MKVAMKKSFASCQTRYSLLVLLGFALLVQSVFGQGVAVLDYPVTVMLHPLMTTYQFSKGAFEKSPMGADEQKYQEWLSRSGYEIQQLQTKHKDDLSARRALVQRLDAERIRLQDKQNETLSSLTSNFDQLRTSKKAEDKALLARMDIQTKMAEFEQKSRKDSLAISQQLEKARQELAEIEALVEAPRWSKPEETRQTFARIESEILSAAQHVMRGKGCALLLNSGGMGWPTPNGPIEKIDPADLARWSDLDLQLYKTFLQSDVRLPAQDAPNPEYRRQVEGRFLQNKSSLVRQALQARSALRLVPEPDLVPRVMVGGTNITIDTVNYILYQYRLSDFHRGLVAQVLREMGVK